MACAGCSDPEVVRGDGGQSACERDGAGSSSAFRERVRMCRQLPLSVMLQAAAARPGRGRGEARCVGMR
jgi:hypothetical protein